MIRDERGRPLFPIPGLPGCYESAAGRRARLEREARRAELAARGAQREAARVRSMIRTGGTIAGQQLAAFAVDEPAAPALFDGIFA